MRLIDIDEIDWEVVKDEYGSRSEPIIACEILISKEPIIDLIWCHECKYCYFDKENNDYICNMIKHRMYTTNHYCSYGQR